MTVFIKKNIDMTVKTSIKSKISYRYNPKHISCSQRWRVSLGLNLKNILKIDIKEQQEKI